MLFRSDDYLTKPFGVGELLARVRASRRRQRGQATGGDGKVRLINESGSDARTFSGASDFMYAGAATPDGRIVIAGGQDGVLRVWNGANGNSIATFEPPKAAAPEPQKTAAVGK